MQGGGYYAPPGAPQSGPPDLYGAAEEMAGVTTAGFPIRAAAHLLDFVVVFIVAIVGGAVAGVMIAALAMAGTIAPGWEQRVQGFTLGAFLIGFLGNVAYFTFGEGLGGASLGKTICGLRVITEDRKHCTFAKALGRRLAFFIDAQFCGIVGYAVMNGNRFHQRLGDKWAHTLVVRNATLPQSLQRSPAVGIIVGIVVSGLIQFAGIIVRAF